MSRDMMLTVDEYMALRRLIDGERESEGSTLAQEAPKPKRRKKSAYNREYARQFKTIAKRRGTFKKKDGTWKKGGFRLAVKLAHTKTKRVMKK